MASVIQPLTITDAILTSSTVPEPDTGEVAWNHLTPYAAGDQAYLPSNHTIYIRLIDGTTATSPDLDPINWDEVGPTNRWKAFDLDRDTGSVATSPFTVVLTPGKRIDAIAVVGMVADRVTIVMTVGGVEKYRYTERLSTRNTQTWSQYFFGAFRFKPDIARLDLPSHVNPVITVTLTRASGPVTCGGILIGNAIYLGEAEIGPTSGGQSFSSIGNDPYGKSELIRRRRVPTADYEIWSDPTLVNTLLDVRDDLDAVVALWLGLEDSNHPYFRTVFILGIYTQFDVTAQEHTAAVTKLSLKGF